jgi:large subunit ribosomal protein L18
MQSRKVKRRNSIRKRIRGAITGTADRPRLSVYRSNKEIYCQLIDDLNHSTIASASSRDASLTGNKGVKKVEQASAVGKLIAEKATAAGISSVVFDRGGYLYHGRVKALAESAREGGLKF